MTLVTQNEPIRRGKSVKQKVPESGVLKACLDLLTAEGIWHERRNTGAMQIGKRFTRFGRPGTADILAVVNMFCGARCCLPPSDLDERALWEDRHCMRLTNKVLWIECKSDTGRQTEDQTLFQKEVEEAGHAYLLVRRPEDLIQWLTERRIIR